MRSGSDERRPTHAKSNGYGYLTLDKPMISDLTMALRDCSIKRAGATEANIPYGLGVSISIAFSQMYVLFFNHCSGRSKKRPGARNRRRSEQRG